MENMTYKKPLYIKYLEIKKRLDLPTIINYIFILYAFSIPINGSLTNAIFTSILILWILDGDFKNKFIFAIKNKFVQAILLFYFIHFLWYWSSDNIVFAKETIRNTRFLLYVIIYISIIKKEFIFKILNGFIYAMMFSEIMSYLIFFEIIMPINHATVFNPVPFVLSHTTYASYLSLSIGLMLFLVFKHKTNKILKIIYFLFFISSTINIFIIASRLGFLLYISSITIVLINIYSLNIKKILIYLIPLLLITYSLAYNFSDIFKSRAYQTVDNVNKVIDNKDFSSSIGSRFAHWYYSYDIIISNPFFGVGDGDQKTLVKENIINSKDESSANLIKIMQNGLHSEILDILVKFGIIGLIIYLNIYYQLFKMKPKEDVFNMLKIILIITFILSSLQGGAIVENVKDLGKIFTLLGVLVSISAFDKLKKQT